jgi:hypothetical protein
MARRKRGSSCAHCAVGELGQVDPLGRHTKAPPWRVAPLGCSHDSDYARLISGRQPGAEVVGDSWGVKVLLGDPRRDR